MTKVKPIYLNILLIFGILALISGLVFEVSFGNPQKWKWKYIIQKYYLKKNIIWPENFNGVWYEWDENGEVIVSTEVKDGVMHGEQLEFYWRKRLKKKQLYKFGRLHGKQDFYDGNGNSPKTINWENGLKNGLYKLNSHSGSLLLHQEYKNDILDGSFESYYEDGGKRIKGKFKNNKPSGEWHFWENTGELNCKLNSDNISDKLEIEKLLRNFIGTIHYADLY